MKDTQTPYEMAPETIEAFLESARSKGASKNMIRRFKCAANSLLDYLADDKTLTKERLSEWRKSLEKSGYASITIQNYVKYINRYLDHAGLSDIRFNRGRFKDITDMQFGYLKAIKPTGEKNRNDYVWLCHCKCGNTARIPATRLLLGNTLSCGCLLRENLKRANKPIECTNLRQALDDRTVNSSSASGFIGVAPKRGKWQAYISYKKKRYSLGCYSDIQDAVKARARAKELVMEDALELLELYNEIHSTDPELPIRDTDSRKALQENKVTANEAPPPIAKRRDNTSGYTGVSFFNGQWISYIGYKGIKYMLGRFEEKTDAVSARCQAEVLLKENAEEFVKTYSKNTAKK